MPRIAEGLHRLGSDLINFYLVADATGVTVVDAGIPAFYDKLAECLEEQGRGWEEVRALVLTHAHPDHVGFAERVRSEHGVPVLVHEADEQRARTQDGAAKIGPSVLPYLRFPAAWRLMGVLARAGPPGRMRIGEVTTFAGGDRLDVPGRPRVIHAPGHTAGCVALHFEGHSALLVGDVLCSRNPLSGRSGVQVMPAPFASDAAQALASVEALDGIQAAVIGFGHGDPWRGGVGAAVAEARATGST
jgi:glyoxylase-like metal-dependent hydrolase (beta-lactamase superfamily II)